jgi:hypothetical protein
MPQTIWIPGIGNTTVPDNATGLPAGSKPVPAPAMSATNTPGMPSATVPAPKLEQGNPYNEILYSKNLYEGQGATDGTKSWAANNADQYYKMLSPDEAAKVHNMNASELQAYIPKLQQPQQATQTQPQPMAPQPPQVNVPAPASPYTMTPDQIRAEAQARIAKQRTALEQSVSATKKGLKNTYDYTNQLTNDRRTLENGVFNRNNNPFSGQTDYLAANLARDRSIQDTASNNQYNAAVSAADKQLADFDTQAPDQTNALVDELTRIERQYGLDVGQLTGNFNGQRTLSAQGQDAQYTGMYGGQMSLPAQMQFAQQFGYMPQGNSFAAMGGQSGQPLQTLSAQQQAFAQQMAQKDANWNAYKDAVDMTGNLGSGPKQDWGQLLNQSGPASASQQRWQDQFDYGKQMDAAKMQQSAQQFAAQLGLDYSKMNQSQQQFLADQAYKYAVLGAQNDPNNLDNRYKQAQLDQLTHKNDASADHGIDQYDLAMVDGLATKAGLDPKKASDSEIMSFVAGLKSQYGWTKDEADAVANHLTSQRDSSSGNSGINQQQAMDYIRRGALGAAGGIPIFGPLITAANAGIGAYPDIKNWLEKLK